MVGAAAEQASQHQDARRPPQEACPAHLDPVVIDGAEDHHAHSFGVWKDEITPTHAVFGLFPCARLQGIRAGFMPVMLITRTATATWR